MAYADLNDHLVYWTQSGQEAERKRTKDVRDGLTWLREKKDRIATRFKKGKNETSLEPKWREGVVYQTRVTGTLTGSTFVLSGYLLNAAISADAMRQFIKPKTILERDDGVKMQISATAADISYSTYTCANCVAHGTSTLSDDTAATTWKILGNPIADYDTDNMPRSLDYGFRSCGHQLFKENFEIPWLAKRIKYDGIRDQRALNVTELIKKINDEINISLLRMEPVYSGGGYVFGYGTQTSTICGVMTWPDITYAEYPNANVYLNKAGQPIDPDDINQVVRGLYYEEDADFNVGDWVLAVPPATHSYISRFGEDERRWTMKENRYGHTVKYFMTDLGVELEIVPDTDMRGDSAAILDCSAFEWGYLEGEEPHTVELARTNDRVDRVMITGGFYGTVCNAPRKKIGKIYGLPTTFV